MKLFMRALNTPVTNVTTNPKTKMPHINSVHGSNNSDVDEWQVSSQELIDDARTRHPVLNGKSGLKHVPFPAK